MDPELIFQTSKLANPYMIYTIHKYKTKMHLCVKFEPYRLNGAADIDINMK